jgi:deoxyribonuclease V
MHPWDLSPSEAIALQKELREQIKLIPLKEEPKLIGGCDVSMDRFATDGFAGFVVLDAKTLRMIDHAVVKRPIPFPYIPGLLSFREIPMLIDAWECLETKPDIILVDGIGIAHPRRMGIATHLGLVLNMPTIGVAKSVLTGIYDEPEEKPGSVSDLRDKKTGEIIGAALRTKLGVKPVFVSAGHLITLEEAVILVKKCLIKHRLPEPTRLAHLIVNEYRTSGVS